MNTLEGALEALAKHLVKLRDDADKVGDRDGYMYVIDTAITRIRASHATAGKGEEPGLREAILLYGTHTSRCGVYKPALDPIAGKCTCGWAKYKQAALVRDALHGVPVKGEQDG